MQLTTQHLVHFDYWPYRWGLLAMPPTQDGAKYKQNVATTQPYNPDLNLSDIYVPYVFYTEAERPKVDLDPADKVVSFLLDLARTGFTHAKRYSESRRSRPEESGPVPPSPTCSSVASYSAFPPMPDDVEFVLFSTSNLSTLLVPMHDPSQILPRYHMTTIVDNPRRDWMKTVIRAGDMDASLIVADYQLKVGTRKGDVTFHERTRSMKAFASWEAKFGSFYWEQFHPARFQWMPEAGSQSFVCLIHSSASSRPACAAVLHPPRTERHHATLVVREEAMECLEMILLTALIMETQWRW